MKRKVLFVAEALTLAQVVRLLVLARGIDREKYDVHFACRDFPELLFGDTDFERSPIYTIDPDSGLSRVEKGERIYDVTTLTRYVESERELFSRVRPDIVVGDFRLSLSVSATLAKVPLLTLINAYWSPYAEREAFPVPDHPIVKLVGPERAARYIDRALPRAFAHFAAPLQQVQKKFGLPAHGDLQEQLCDGDYTLYPDVPELVPTRRLPESHVYLGPVPWSPRVPLPDWWQGLDPTLPTVYVTLGSSGAAHVLPLVFEALSSLQVNVLFALAGRTGESFRGFEAIRSSAGRVFVADYLPGDEAARRSAFVISNGGASTSYQALGEGVPVLGIPYNLDQYLAMTAIEQAGAGILLRAGNLALRPLQQACVRLLNSSELKRGALAVQRAFSAYDCHARFAGLLSKVNPTG
ncbi:MAG TPA: nucleotide disphospho-sugar-binding domain-containing protein [Polyangiaceae bacterium]|nr:nucleotide disphospho-sugar-binding domain-containing protein [Polyangiaceae bacterium]